MKKIKKALPLLPYFLFFAGTLIYLSLLFNENLWLDEAFTACLVRTSFPEVLRRSMNDTLPPLYNILLKLATSLFGVHIPVMKAVSALSPVLLMWLSATVLNRRYGSFVSSLYILCLFSMPQFLFYGVEIRMYSLGLFFVGACGIYGLELLYEPGRKNLILTGVFAALSGYTHHFALVSAGFIYLALLVCFLIKDKTKLKLWFASAITAALLYLPCFLTTLKQIKRVSGFFSMPDMTAATMVKYLRYPYTTGNRLASILLAASIVYLALSFLKSRKVQPTDWLSGSYLINYVLVLGFGWLAAQLIGAGIFVDRYLFPSFSLLWLFFSIEAGKLSVRRRAAFVLLTCFCGVSGYLIQWKAEYDPGILEMQAYFDARADEYDGYLIPSANSSPNEASKNNPEAEFEVMECLLFYYPQLIPYRADSSGITYAEIDFTPESEASPADVSGLKLWLISEKPNPKLPAYLARRGYLLGPVKNFRFDRYQVFLCDLLPPETEK